MTDPAPTSVAPETRFESLGALRSVHLALIERQAVETPSGTTVIDPQEVTAFLIRVCATGAILDKSEDRQTAQRVIDYWKADLVAEYRKAATDPAPMRLAPFKPAAPEVASPDPTAAAYTKDELRQYIRVSALAREWRDSGASGYLLSDDALTEAKKFIRDADIRKFVEASSEAELKREKQRARWKNGLITALVVVVLALAGLTGLALMQRKAALDLKEVAEEQTQEAKAQARDIRDINEKLQAALSNSQRLYDDLQSQSTAASNRLADLEQRQRVLDAVIEAFGNLIIQNHLGLADIPLSIRDETLTYIVGRMTSHTVLPGDLAPDVAAAVRAMMPELTISAFDGSTLGYDPDFLGVPMPLPELSDLQRSNAVEKGKAFPYLHYSLVLDARRRFALFAAANLDRSQLAVLPGAAQALAADPRLLPGLQPDPLWYRRTMLDVAYLVMRNDVTWGMGSKDSDSSLADQLVNVYPNTAPLSLRLAPGWQTVEDWIRVRHNPAASRVTLLSGLIFRPSAAPGEPPIALWKIAVSAAPALQQQSVVGRGLVADAFLVELPAKGLPTETADVETFRTTVAEIARRSGLTFSAAVLAADLGPGLLSQTAGDRLGAEVGGLDGPVAADRKALAQRLVSAVRDGALDAADQKKVVAALVESLQSAADQSPTGRLNLLFVLSQVPASSWNRPDWMALKAAARRATADLTLMSQAGQLDIGSQTRPHLVRLRTALGLDVAPPQVVYFQFSGFTRERAGQVQAALQGLGWNMPGVEKRLEGAIGQNEVRYSPDNPKDASAALLLAADLRAAGLPGAMAVANRLIKPGTLEIWTDGPARY